jgi:hypothetical protein
MGPTDSERGGGNKGAVLERDEGVVDEGDGVLSGEEGGGERKG